MPEIRIPWRPDLELFDHRLPEGAAQKYAFDLVKRGLASESDRRVLETALERAALYYFFGQSINPTLKDQGSEEPEDPAVEELRKFVELARPPRNRPPNWGDLALIWTMAEIWVALGGRPGTAEGIVKGRDALSRFQTFCESWIRIIDSNRNHLPKRKTYRNALKKRRAAIPSS